MIISRATVSVAFKLLLIATFSSNAQSAEIKIGVDKSGQATIWITGQIVPGNADGFSRSVHQPNDAGNFVADMRPDSPDNNFLEGNDCRRYEVWQDTYRSSFQAPSFPITMPSSCVMSKLRTINHAGTTQAETK